MTAQQLLLNGTSTATGPIYIGFNKNRNTNASRVKVLTPSTTQVGDLILLFATGASNASTSISWSCTNTSVTEVKDAGAAPNLYFGYGYAATSGAISYQLISTVSSDLRLVAIVYRNAVCDRYTYTSSSGSTTVNLLLDASGYPAAIAGFGAALRGSATWTISNGATVLWNAGGSYPVAVAFKKDDIVDYQNFAITGQLSSVFQGILVSITTSAYTPPAESVDYWSDWPTQIYSWQESVVNEWWAC